MWQKLKSFLSEDTMTEDESKIKAKKYFNIDPFPSIPPALLNSADIESYVNATGMIHPFDPKGLKSSSYGVKMKGKCKWWDEHGKPNEIDLNGEKNKRFKLFPNTIAFIELEPMFRLPEYIALRFILRIKNIYRGLLLGTGPLVDPGFEGKIFIPLHNLTSREYLFEYDEELVWFEFTKTSPIKNRTVLAADEVVERGEYKDFPKDKKNKNLDNYLDSASKGEPIISAIPDAIGKTKKSAKDAQKSLSSIRKWGLIAALGVVISTASLITASWNFVSASWSLQERYTNKVQELDVLVRKSHIEDVMQHNSKINELEYKIKDLHNEINALKTMYSLSKKKNSKKNN